LRVNDHVELCIEVEIAVAASGFVFDNTNFFNPTSLIAL